MLGFIAEAEAAGHTEEEARVIAFNRKYSK